MDIYDININLDKTVAICSECGRECQPIYMEDELSLGNDSLSVDEWVSDCCGAEIF